MGRDRLRSTWELRWGGHGDPQFISLHGTESDAVGPPESKAGPVEARVRYKGLSSLQLTGSKTGWFPVFLLLSSLPRAWRSRVCLNDQH